MEGNKAFLCTVQEASISASVGRKYKQVQTKSPSLQPKVSSQTLTPTFADVHFPFTVPCQRCGKPLVVASEPFALCPATLCLRDPLVPLDYYRHPFLPKNHEERSHCLLTLLERFGRKVHPRAWQFASCNITLVQIRGESTSYTESDTVNM